MGFEVKFCTAKRTHVNVGPAKFDVNRCNESPLRGEKRDFWPVSKFNTGSLPIRGNPAGKKTYKHHVFAPTAGARCTIFPRLYTVTELFVTIKKVSSFFDPTHSFSYMVYGKIRPNLQTRGFSAIIPLPVVRIT